MEQPGKFLPCPSRAGHRYPEDMADPLRRLPSTTEDLQVVIPCRNRALFLQRGIRITLQPFYDSIDCAICYDKCAHSVLCITSQGHCEVVNGLVRHGSCSS